ncbi:MAG: ferritin [Thaumarchaeota archaeon]|nr:ferritin [Nitrososphaerota archaeon]
MKGKDIVKLDVNDLLDLLNKALADEWLAYYQYWVGSKIVAGPMKDAVAKELAEHAGEELQHAEMLVNRIIHLEGKPLLDPRDWFKQTNCGYEVPEDPYVETLLKQNIKGERCAIEVYYKLLEFTKDKDPITAKMVLEILEDEIEHEADLQALLEDLTRAK